MVKGTSSRAQLHAQATDEFFKYHILLITHKYIERVKKDVCEQVKAMPIEEVRQEVKDWVVDPGSMATQATPYDHMIMLYWVIMNLVTHVSFNIEAKKEEMAAKKEGDQELARD